MHIGNDRKFSRFTVGNPGNLKGDWHDLFLMLTIRHIYILFKRLKFAPFACPKKTNFTPFGCPRQLNLTPFSCLKQPNFTPFQCLRQLPFEVHCAALVVGNTKLVWNLVVMDRKL